MTRIKHGWRDRWRLYSLTASPRKIAARNAGIAALLALGLSLMFLLGSSWRSEGRDDLVIVAACVNTVLIGIASYIIDINFIKKRRQTMDEYVHQQLSAEDRVELYDWAEYGKLPPKSLQPAMPGMADYVHDVHMNATFKSLSSMYLWMAILGSHISISAVVLVAGAGAGDSDGHKFAVIAYSVFLAILVATRIRPLEHFYQPLGKKAKRKVAELREQAAAVAGDGKK